MAGTNPTCCFGRPSQPSNRNPVADSRRIFLKTCASRALTLIEIMIVIAIIALVAALVINRYTASLGQGRSGATELEIKQIANAVDSYYNDKGAYPMSGTVNPALFGGGTLNQYMGNTPADGGFNYTFTSPPTGGDYTICSGRPTDGATVSRLLTTTGATPVTGTNYNVCYSPQYGEYAVSAAAP